MTGPVDRSAELRLSVQRQSEYLRNLLSPGEEAVCDVCFGPVRNSRSRCLTCREHHEADGAGLADAVFPISYAVKGTQLAHHLAAYKAPVNPPEESRRALLDLLLWFGYEHGGCVKRAAKVSEFTGIAVVPSTSGRPGTHPLRLLIGDRLRRPWIELTANRGIRSGLRSYKRDRFTVAEPEAARGGRVLLIEDTWVTGSRVQAAAYALKQSGAERVAVVVLGRHIGDDTPVAREVRNVRFRLDTCAHHTR